LDRAEVYVDLADQSARAVPHKRLADFTLARTIVSLYAARLRGEFEDALAAARKVLTGHSSTALSVSSGDRRVVALLNLGIAEFWVGEMRQAQDHLEDALALARHGGSEFLVLTVLGRLALLDASRGALRRAATLAEEALELAERRGWAGLPQSAPLHLALALRAYHSGGLEEARRHVERAALAARPSRERTVEARCQILRARVLCAAGDVEEAEGVVRAAHRYTEGWSMPRTLAASFAATQGKVLGAAGRADEALAVVEADEHYGRWAELDLVKARLTLHEGGPAAALAVMKPSLDRSVPALHPSTNVELQALAALANHLRGDDGAALEHMERALELAEPEGYRQVLLEVGGPLRELLMRRIRAGTAHRALAGDLADALDARSGRQADGEALLLDPLSGREEAVLRYLPTVLSKAEIASEMFVSVNTVKTHMKNIYRKLDVTNRGEAVRRAKSVHLV
jgi:LuxR family transcriptional regulator, maltose regulon positive regulatory protein